MLTALMILLIAGLAGINLWFLVKQYAHSSRSAATLSALQYGTLLTKHLARQPFLQTVQPAPGDAEQFNRAVDLLQHIEPELEYVTITERDVVLYHKETTPPSSSVPQPAPAQPVASERTHISPKKLYLGSNIVPVITFTRQLNMADGRQRSLQIALKKDIVEREQAGASTAITTMFNLSLITIGVSFGICLLAIIGLVRRELSGERRRRQDEHLAFAGAVASSIIHDFRNPMSAMRLDAQLLQQESNRGADSRPMRMNELATRINTTIDRLDILLLEFLLIAKPEAVEREHFDINASLHDGMDLLKLRFEKAGIRTDTSLAEQPLSIQGYPIQFKRALLNIIHNAEHYAPPGSAVTIRTRAEGSDAIVEILDEGPGIPARDRERIFDLFYSNRPGGTGIGLALTKTAVENCGGTVAVRPGPQGKGSCFVIRVPLATA